MSANAIYTPPPDRNEGPLHVPLTMNSRWMRLNRARRHAVNHAVTFLAILSTVLVIVPLVAILVYLLYMGAHSINLAFLYQDSRAGG